MIVIVIGNCFLELILGSCLCQFEASKPYHTGHSKSNISHLLSLSIVIAIHFHSVLFRYSYRLSLVLFFLVPTRHSGQRLSTNGIVHFGKQFSWWNPHFPYCSSHHPKRGSSVVALHLIECIRTSLPMLWLFAYEARRKILGYITYWNFTRIDFQFVLYGNDSCGAILRR